MSVQRRFVFYAKRNNKTPNQGPLTVCQVDACVPLNKKKPTLG